MPLVFSRPTPVLRSPGLRRVDRSPAPGPAAPSARPACVTDPLRTKTGLLTYEFRDAPFGPTDRRGPVWRANTEVPVPVLRPPSSVSRFSLAPLVVASLAVLAMVTWQIRRTARSGESADAVFGQVAPQSGAPTPDSGQQAVLAPTAATPDSKPLPSSGSPASPTQPPPTALRAVANRDWFAAHEASETDLLRSGREALARGDVISARSMLGRSYSSAAEVSARNAIRDELSRVADASIFSPRVLSDDSLVAVYNVTRGDSLTSIARHFKITDDLLAQINDLPGKNRIASGRLLKIVRGPFCGLVHKSEYRLDVMLGDVLVRSFPCGLGANDGTPTGRWIVRDKLPNPAWTDPRTHEHFNADDPDNPIGEYWVGLEGVTGDAAGRRGFGIHGTIEPASIGRQLSLGCVRLAPADIEIFYRLVVTGESSVDVLP